MPQDCTYNKYERINERNEKNRKSVLNHFHCTIIHGSHIRIGISKQSLTQIHRRFILQVLTTQ